MTRAWPRLLPRCLLVLKSSRMPISAALQKSSANSPPRFPRDKLAAIPEFADSPPLGMAVKFSSAGAEGHLVVTAETLRTIGDAVAKARGAASAPSN